MIFVIDVVGRWVCGVRPSLSVSLPQVMLVVLLLDDGYGRGYYAGRHPG